MELIKYLNDNFFTEQELLNVSKVTEQELCSYQEQGVMPKCSYKLNVGITCDSFFGLHKEEQKIEYYAKGYSSWLAIIQSLKSTNSIYSVFVNRYKKTIACLKQQGHRSDNSKINSAIDLHIKEEWGHFLSGTYGLCTKSGLPEDIAAKEFAIIEINELSAQKLLNQNQLGKLTTAVNLLDSASSYFAPHERLTSSRYRLVNETRLKYKLQN